MDLLLILSGAGIFALGTIFGAYVGRGRLGAQRYVAAQHKAVPSLEASTERAVEASLVNPFYNRAQFLGDAAGTFQGPIPAKGRKAQGPPNGV